MEPGVPMPTQERWQQASRHSWTQAAPQVAATATRCVRMAWWATRSTLVRRTQSLHRKSVADTSVAGVGNVRNLKVLIYRQFSTPENWRFSFGARTRE